MKSLLVVLAVLFATAVARASNPVDELVTPAKAGKGTVYLRVALEKRNGIDMREYSMAKDMIQALEKQGASVRPNRTDANVSFWIFFKNGDFATCDVVNQPVEANLPYAKLGEFFADAPHDGPKWRREGERLAIGRRYYTVQVLTANDPVTGGLQGEYEIAVVDGAGKKLYYYFGKVVSP